jgi:hypothetical protein
VRALDFHEVRQRYRDDFRAIPSLAEGLAGFLGEIGVLEPDEATAPPRRAAG